MNKPTECIFFAVFFRQSKIIIKSKIGWGFLLIAFAFVRGWGCGRGAAAEESPSDRVSIGVPTQLLIPPVPRQFGWLCASLAT